MTFGSLELARELYSLAGTRDIPFYSDSVDGFEPIGSGCYRDAYLHRESGLVYKVGSYFANVHESRKSRELMRKSTAGLKFDLRIPRTRTYRMRSGTGYPECVVVQEFAPNCHPTVCDIDYRGMCTCEREYCYKDIHLDVENWSGLIDIHYDNVLEDDKGVFWLIDMGA